MGVGKIALIDARRFISVILPTFNEHDNIVPVICAILEYLAGFSVEVLVVDDNSPDGTADCVRQAFPSNPDVRVIVRLADHSFAKSIRAGIEAANGDIIVVMDSDFNHQPKYLPFMIEALNYYDVVMGSRFLYGGRMFPRSRHLLSWVFNCFVRCATGGSITDNLYGFFAVRKKTLLRCNFAETFYGYGEYFIRLLYEFQQMGLRILQFPAVNGRRLHGEGNRRFVRTFRIYVAATAWLVVLKGRLKRVFDDSEMPNLQQPAPGIDSASGQPGPHRILPATRPECVSRSA